MNHQLDFDLVLNTIRESQITLCPNRKRSLLKKIEEWETVSGFVSALISIIQLPNENQEEKQLSAILLKNAVLRIVNNEELRKKHGEEIESTKSFLLNSFEESQHQVSIQLHSLTSKLAREYWPHQWPELVPTLLSKIGNDSQFMTSFKATCCLHEVIIELACKATCGGSFYSIYYELCLQLFQSMAKCWALRMKSIQAYLMSCANQVSKELDGTFFGGHDSLMESSQCFIDETQQTSLFYTIVMAKILKMIIETTLTDILKRFSCFKCFWKTYMGSIQIAASFIRKVRPRFSRLTDSLKVSQKTFTNPTQSLAPNKHSMKKISILEKFHSLDVDDFNYAADFFFDYGGFDDNRLSEDDRGFIDVVNLVMKLSKVLSCLPIHLQKKYPIEMVPFLEDLVHFYYKFLVDEISVDFVQNLSLDVLPLTTLSVASQVILGNIITCAAYKDFNLYSSSQRGPHSLAEAEVETAMEESVLKESVFAAHNFILDFFDDSRVKELVQRQLAFTLTYSPRTLLLWAKEPEKFCIDEESAGMTVEYLFLRTSAERLFLALLEIKPAVVTQIIVPLLQDVNRQNLVTSSEGGSEARNSEILFWDAVYTATGLGVARFAEDLGVSPTDWLLGIIGPLFNNLLKSEKCGALHPLGQQVLRARILKLISSWISQFDVSVHSLILEFLVNLLACASQADVVVQLSAVKCLSSLVNLKNFQYRSLLPLAVPCIRSLVCLVRNRLEESESKSQVLSLIKDFIQLIAVQRFPAESTLLLSDCLFSLWDSQSLEEIAKSSLLEVFVTLVQSMKETCTGLIDSQGSSLSERLLSLAVSCLDGSSEKRSNCLDVSVVLESLLLLETVARNCESRVVSTSPSVAASFVAALDWISATVLSLNALHGEDNLFVKLDGERNLQVVVERVSRFVEALVLLLESFAENQRSVLISSLQRVFSQLAQLVPPKAFRPILRCMEVLLIAAPQATAEMLFQSRALSVSINICLSQAVCPNLSGLMKSFDVSKEVFLSAANVLSFFVLVAPSVLLQGLQIVKEDILLFLFRVSGVTNTNLSEAVILQQLICVLLKAAELVEAMAASKIAAIYRLRLYCFALWSFFPPTRVGAREGEPELELELVVPKLYPLQQGKTWLGDLLRLFSRYVQLCEEFFVEEESDWKQRYFSEQLSTMVEGSFPRVAITSEDLARLFSSHEEAILKSFGAAMISEEQVHQTLDPSFRLRLSLQRSEQRFYLFHQAILSGVANSGIEHLDPDEQIVEKEDSLLSLFLQRLLSHRLHRTCLQTFVRERLLTLERSLDRDFLLTLDSPFFSARDS